MVVQTSRRSFTTGMAATATAAALHIHRIGRAQGDGYRGFGNNPSLHRRRGAGHVRPSSDDRPQLTANGRILSKRQADR
jgi:hypothetical protein